MYEELLQNSLPEGRLLIIRLGNYELDAAAETVQQTHCCCETVLSGNGSSGAAVNESGMGNTDSQIVTMQQCIQRL